MNRYFLQDRLLQFMPDIMIDIFKGVTMMVVILGLIVILAVLFPGLWP